MKLCSVRRAARLAAWAVLVLTAGACDHDDGSPAPAGEVLSLLRSVSVAVPEPSDLCLDRDGVHAWTVSDQTGRIYRLRLADGGVAETLDWVGSDPEGIWQDPLDGTLYVAEEGLRQIVHVDADGDELGRVSVAGLGGDANSGLEGLTSGPATGRFQVVKEKGPALLLAVAADGAVLASHTITFVGDLSGVAWDTTEGRLWIVSDESACLVQVDAASGAALARYDIAVDKAEGVAIDPASGHFYVISDSQAQLYEYVLSASAVAARAAP